MHIASRRTIISAVATACTLAGVGVALSLIHI